ncbi:MAG: C25 family cysteine peptidase [Candidatus Aminicenantes bacterium]|jgi:hypothetical protein
MVRFLNNKGNKNQLTCGAYIFFLIIFSLLLIPYQAFAANTPTGELLKQLGSGAAASSGDYISSSGGLNTYYSYFIEVPPGLSQMRVGIFDADVGLGAANDWRTGSWNTAVTYTLYNPGGTAVGSVTGSSTGPPGSNNAWLTYNINNPAAGHWEIRVNMSSSVTTGNDMNGYGLGAIDPVNNTELNIYAESFSPLGVLGSGATQNTTLYPYITSGCTVDSNDWDGDNRGLTLCTISITSRTGNFSSSFNGSGGTAWLNNPLSGFTTDILSSDYGVWSSTLSYTDAGGGANFGVFYMGNYNASNPPPTSQPEIGSFRIYFRSTTGAGAPLKPFLTQNLSHVSGPNPPISGSTTRVKVGVTIFNPTPFSITFSASNLVIANVPGSGTVYAGNASVTQGTITGQPSIGGTGNITWNPGSVSGSNNYETLDYEVDVTPTFSGQRIPVTGTPGTNGTTATYVDETGNTTQARATFTFGPLCELAITEAGNPIPTLAAVSSFNVYDGGGQAVVQWETASEIGTAGFYLSRKDQETGKYQPVNQSLLTGLLNSPQGGVYRFTDRSAVVGETYTYKLIEVESKGQVLTHGPFTVTIDQSLPGTEPMEETYSKKPHEMSLEKKTRLQERKLALETAVSTKRSKSQGQNAAKIAIKEKGLYYLDAAMIADVLSMSASQVSQRIRNYNFIMSNRGKKVTYIPTQGNTGLYFYGENIENIYTDENIYWLEKGKGSSMDRVYGGMPPPAGGSETFTDKLHIEEDHYALTALFDDPGDDFWLWDYISAGQTGKEFKFSTPDAAASGTASLTIHLKGGSNTSANPDHHAKVKLNGTPIGEGIWNGTKMRSFTMSFSQSLLNDGENTIEVSGTLENGVPYSIFYLDSFDLNYHRYYRAVNNRLFCRGNGNVVITVEGFTDPDIMVFDVTDPLHPRLVTGTTIDGSYRVSFTPSAPGNPYLVLNKSAVQSPLSFRADHPSQLKRKQNSADYVMIVGNGLEDAVQDLVYLRERKGFKTMVVELEDIYDEFNHGISNPGAIQAFLSYAYRKWKGKIPAYAVLVGDGSYDYKDNLGYGDNLVPPFLVSTPKGLFASDNRFGDVKGKNGVPEIAVGRLPVVTGEELRALIDKISAYEETSGEWTDRVIMLADNPDNGGDFSSDSDTLATLVPPGYIVDKIYLADFPTVNQARQDILEAFNRGAVLVNYIGHAGLDRLAAEKLLGKEDISLLQNENRVPIMTAITCVVGRFAIAGYDTLAERLLLLSHGGTAAVWAPTGASLNRQNTLLAEKFFNALFRGRETTLGQALLKAMKGYAALDGDPVTLKIYNLLGDPALMIK